MNPIIQSDTTSVMTHSIDLGATLGPMTRLAAEQRAASHFGQVNQDSTLPFSTTVVVRNGRFFLQWLTGLPTGRPERDEGAHTGIEATDVEALKGPHRDGKSGGHLIVHFSGGGLPVQVRSDLTLRTFSPVTAEDHHRPDRAVSGIRFPRPRPGTSFQREVLPELSDPFPLFGQALQEEINGILKSTPVPAESPEDTAEGIAQRLKRTNTNTPSPEGDAMPRPREARNRNGIKYPTTEYTGRPPSGPSGVSSPSRNGLTLDAAGPGGIEPKPAARVVDAPLPSRNGSPRVERSKVAAIVNLLRLPAVTDTQTTLARMEASAKEDFEVHNTDPSFRFDPTIVIRDGNPCLRWVHIGPQDTELARGAE